MTTSRAYAEAAPPWLTELARARPAGRFIGQAWTPLDAAALARTTGVADHRPGEGDVHGLGIAFPHPILDADAIVQTPFGDEVVLDAVYAALDAMELGADEVPDLLAVSLNAHDYAGHTWGPDSWESLDLTLRLDAALGTLFDTLDRRLGRAGWALVMTSDHGVTPLVESGQVPGAQRISPMVIAEVAERVIAARLGPGPWVAGVVANQLYVTSRWPRAPAAARAPALRAAAEAVAALPGMASVHLTAGLFGGCERRAALARAICHALAPGASGELYVVPARGSMITELRHRHPPRRPVRRQPAGADHRPRAGARPADRHRLAAPGRADGRGPARHPRAARGARGAPVRPTVAVRPARAVARRRAPRRRTASAARAWRRTSRTSSRAAAGSCGERHHVLVGDVAEREVHAPGAEALELRGQIEALLVVDALHAVEQVVLPARAAEDLQRAVLEPLRADRRRIARPAPDELEARALAERQRRDGAGLEVAVLADARGVDRLAALGSVAVEVHEAGVEVPAPRHDAGGNPLAHPALDPGDQPREHGRERLGRDRDIERAPGRLVVAEAGELPVAEPVDRAQQRLSAACPPGAGGVVE